MLYFPSETVSNHITRIFAFGSELMYLIEGSAQNVLIDTGCGFGSLKTAVERILSSHKNTKPLLVLLSHGHVDHACGAGEFIAAGIPVYISFADRYIYGQQTDETLRKAGLSIEKFDGHGTYEEAEDYIPSVDFEAFRELNSGDSFDLGGVVVEAHACPGHTLGSLVFLIKEENGGSCLLTGDACNTHTFLFSECSTSVEEYEESLAALSDRLRGRYDRVLFSHGDGNGYVGILEDVCEICRRIKSGDVDALPFSAHGEEGKLALLPVPGKGNIVYRPDRIWKKDTVIR